MVANLYFFIIIAMLSIHFHMMLPTNVFKNPAPWGLLTFPNTPSQNSPVSDAIFSCSSCLHAALRPASFGHHDLNTSLQIWPDLPEIQSLYLLGEGKRPQLPHTPAVGKKLWNGLALWAGCIIYITLLMMGLSHWETGLVQSNPCDDMVLALK